MMRLVLLVAPCLWMLSSGGCLVGRDPLVAEKTLVEAEVVDTSQATTPTQVAKMGHRVIVKSPVVMRGIVGKRPPHLRGSLAHPLMGNLQDGEKAVMRALRWLKFQQQADGSWPGEPISTTGIALLPFLAHGETPDSNSVEFGPSVEKGFRYLIDNQNQDGSFKLQDADIAAQPIATFALCEAYELTKIADIKKSAEKALEHLISREAKSESESPNLTSPDKPVRYKTWYFQALSSARRVSGLDIKDLEKAYQHAENELKALTQGAGELRSAENGQGEGWDADLFCAELLRAFQSDETLEMPKALEACVFDFKNWENQPYSGESPITHWTYITLAKFRVRGSQWLQWNRPFQEELINRQVVLTNAIEGAEGQLLTIGYWDSPSKSEYHAENGGSVIPAIQYANGVEIKGKTTLGARIQDTSLCALQFTVYYRYLPFFRPRTHSTP